MEYRISGMNVFVMDDYDSMGKKASEIITGCIGEKKSVGKPAVIGFATGSTPLSTYKALIESYRAGHIDFSNVISFNLDEYFPIKKTSDQSYDYFMRQNLFNHININADRINIPNGEAADYKTECAEYELKIETAGGIDLQILGVGLNGHIGFNEPGDIFEKETRYVALDESTIEANSRFFESRGDVPRHALSMGIRTIMRSKKIVLLANGIQKAEIVKQTILGDITPGVPASVLQLHQDVTIVLDKPAASLLSLV